MTQYLLGIDNGSTATKAALFDLAGRELAVAGRKPATSSPAPGWHEREMDAMWRATAEAIREVLQKSGVDPGEIAAVAAAGYGNGLYLVDKAGRPVRPAIDSSDGRARAIIDRWLAAGVWERVLPQTAQSLWPAQPNALLAWLRDHEPETLARACWVLCAKDYTRFRLTGHIAMELTDMSATSLMSVTEGHYDGAILDAFGLGDLSHLMPPLVRPEEIVGEVTAAAAAETGLRAGTPVAAGMFDIDACGLAAGMVEESQLVLVSGTWGNNQYISTTPVVSKKIFMTSCYAIPGHYLMLEGSPTSAGNLEWILGELLGGALDYDALSAEVAATAPADGAHRLPAVPLRQQHASRRALVLFGLAQRPHARPPAARRAGGDRLQPLHAPAAPAGVPRTAARNPLHRRRRAQRSLDADLRRLLPDPVRDSGRDGVGRAGRGDRRGGGGGDLWEFS